MVTLLFQQLLTLLMKELYPLEKKKKVNKPVMYIWYKTFIL